MSVIENVAFGGHLRGRSGMLCSMLRLDRKDEAGRLRQAERGSIVTVTGTNGAGKTTLLDAILGLIPSSGGVMLGDEDTTLCRSRREIRRGLCLVTGRRELFVDMSVADNLGWGGYLRTPLQRKETLEQIYKRFHI